MCLERRPEERTNEGYIKALFRASDSTSVDEQASRSPPQPQAALPTPRQDNQKHSNDPNPKIQSSCSRAYANDFAYSNGRGVMTTYCCWLGTYRVIRPNTIEISVGAKRWMYVCDESGWRN
jgi:hypothetical protein